MKVTVLFGGPSSEREVSLVSGRAVIQGLIESGHDVFPSDISPDDLSGLDRPCDVVFPVLHGDFGESGELQDILDDRGLAFVGAGSKASRLGIDKHATKLAWEKAGLPTPPYQFITDPSALQKTKFTGACVVKAVNAGSSIDVFICKSSEEAHEKAADVLSRHGSVLVETFIDGPELTVGLLEEKPLDPIRIVPKRAFFDYEAKYRDTGTEHRFDTGLPGEVVEQCRELAQKANEVVGARDLARVDMMLDSANQPYLLEINTMPGFTPKSLLPEAAGHAGITFSQLVDRLVKRAAARKFQNTASQRVANG